MRINITKYILYVYDGTVLKVKIYSKDVKAKHKQLGNTPYAKIDTRQWIKNQIINVIGDEEYNRLFRNFDYDPATGQMIVSNITRV